MLKEPLITLDVENQAVEVTEPKWKRLHAWVSMVTIVVFLIVAICSIIMILVDDNGTYVVITGVFAGIFFLVEMSFRCKYGQQQWNTLI